MAFSSAPAGAWDCCAGFCCPPPGFSWPPRSSSIFSRADWIAFCTCSRTVPACLAILTAPKATAPAMPPRITASTSRTARPRFMCRARKSTGNESTTPMRTPRNASRMISRASHPAASAATSATSFAPVRQARSTGGRSSMRSPYQIALQNAYAVPNAMHGSEQEQAVQEFAHRCGPVEMALRAFGQKRRARARTRAHAAQLQRGKDRFEGIR